MSDGRLPLTIPVKPWFRDHCFAGKIVLPAVETMLLLAAKAHELHPEVDIRVMENVRFAKFLEIPPAAATVAGLIECELVSKGNFALINAVEEFDYTMGLRFSRRASLNIAKEYAKLSGKSTGLIKARVGALKNLERGAQKLMTRDFAAIERAHQSLTQVIEDNLTKREQHVILNRFGLIGSRIKKESKTLKQIGEELGLSKERVRQVELTALQKLRQSLSSAEFELLIG